MDLPIRVLVTRPSASSQLWFAREAADEVMPSPLVRAEPKEDGLVLHGMTEAVLEMVCLTLQKKYPDIHFGGPAVEYIETEELLEPYYLASVDTPEDLMGEVMGDLSSRRGMIVAVSDCPTGKTIKAEVPVAECFGYSIILRRLTKGRGHYELKFIGYRPAPRYRGGGDPINVA